MKFIYKVNGEERLPTDEERRKITDTFMQNLGYRPVKRQKVGKPSEGDVP